MRKLFVGLLGLLLLGISTSTLHAQDMFEVVCLINRTGRPVVFKYRDTTMPEFVEHSLERKAMLHLSTVRGTVNGPLTLLVHYDEDLGDGTKWVQAKLDPRGSSRAGDCVQGKRYAMTSRQFRVVIVEEN